MAAPRVPGGTTCRGAAAPPRTAPAAAPEPGAQHSPQLLTHPPVARHPSTRSSLLPGRAARRARVLQWGRASGGGREWAAGAGKVLDLPARHGGTQLPSCAAAAGCGLQGQRGRPPQAAALCTTPKPVASQGFQICSAAPLGCWMRRWASERKPFAQVPASDTSGWPGLPRRCRSKRQFAQSSSLNAALGAHLAPQRCSFSLLLPYAWPIAVASSLSPHLVIAAAAA